MKKPEEKRVTQRDIALRAGIDVSSVNKSLRHSSGATFSRDTVRQVFQIARELGYDVGRLKHTHVRVTPRRAVKLPADLALYLGDGSLFDRGRALVREVSFTGALLSEVSLARGVLPASPFRVVLRIKKGEGIDLTGRVVRLLHGAELDLGVKFLDLEPAAQAALGRLLKVRVPKSREGTLRA